MYPRPVAQLLKSTAPPASRGTRGLPPAPASDSLSYDDWIRDDWVRSSCPSLRSGTTGDPAEEPPGTG